MVAVLYGDLFIFFRICLHKWINPLNLHSLFDFVMGFTIQITGNALGMSFGTTTITGIISITTITPMGL